jgi:hypothetical protein
MDVLLERVAERGLADEGAARRAMAATVAVMAERLVDDEVKTLAAAVPMDLVASVANSEYDSDFSSDELFERIRYREHATSARPGSTHSLSEAAPPAGHSRSVAREGARGEGTFGSLRSPRPEATGRRPLHRATGDRK